MAALGGILGGLLEKELNLFFYIGKMKAWKKREVLEEEGSFTVSKR